MQNALLTAKCDLLNFLIDSGSKSFRDLDGCTDTYVDKSLIVQCYDHIVKTDLAAVYSWIL